MTKFVSYFKLSVLVFALPVLLSCGGDDDDGNPIIDLNDPSTFPGTYEMVELTAKTSFFSLPAGSTLQGGQETTVPYQVAPGQTVNATITLTHTLVLTSTTYNSSFSIDVEIPNAPVQTFTDEDSGTYSLNGNELTTTSSDDGEVEVNTISVENGQMIYENDDLRVVYEKQ